MDCEEIDFALSRRLHPFFAFQHLAAVSKKGRLATWGDAGKLITEYLVGTRCVCSSATRYYRNWSIIYRRNWDHPTWYMKSADLRAWAEKHNRPDMFLHADCIEHKEKHRERLVEEAATRLLLNV